MNNDTENIMEEATELKLSNRDLLVMRIIHYFVTKKNYNPVILHGINDEIWLENLDEPYKIIRIVNHYIHNNEQLLLDQFKLKKILNKLKAKTLSFKLTSFSIYTDLGDTVDLKKDSPVNEIFIKDLSDFDNPDILKIFPDLDKEALYDEEGIELFMKITNEINIKNTAKAKRAEELFTPKKPWITYLIMGICIITFLLMYVFGNGSEDNLTLLKFGANLDVLTKRGEYYRILTCIFLHIGIVHLLLNMYSLYIIGPQVESFYGKIKYLFIYLYSGICGSILSLAFSNNVISAGASGAIFGLLGSLLYFGYHYRVYLGNVIKSQIIPVILVNLFIGFITPGIDNFAHIGGLIGGVIASMICGVKDKHNKIDRINGMILGIIYTAFIIYLGLIR